LGVGASHGCLPFIALLRFGHDFSGKASPRIKSAVGLYGTMRDRAKKPHGPPRRRSRPANHAAGLE
jgi:hypothetical protein